MELVLKSPVPEVGLILVFIKVYFELDNSIY